MTHPARLATLTLGAFATIAAAACAGAPTASEPSAAQLPVDVLFTAAPEGGTVTESDSVVGGYGTESTGGIDYTCFEYDPATGTETVVTDDPDAASKGLICTTASDPEMTDPVPPPPPPPPAPSRSYTSTTSADSVQSGYGSGSTGGIEYENFEYEPETGTEYVATPDSTAASSGLTPTTTSPTPTKP